MNNRARWAALAVGILAGASVTSGCEDLSDNGTEVFGSDGSRRGELVLYQADNFETGTSQLSYFLRDATGAEVPLHFDSSPGLEPGTRIKVSGVSEGDGLRVTSFARLPAPATSTTQSALIGAAPFAARSFAFVLVDIGGGLTPVRWDNVQNELTQEFVLRRLLNDDDSLRNYYLGVSYQMQDITARVIGPLSYSMSGCDTSGMAANSGNGLRPMVDAMGGPFQHYLWFFGTNTSSCNWSGLASVGTPQSPQRNTWYNHSVGCVVLIQEPGHNFGMQHSSSLDCGSNIFNDDPNSGCTASEYGDSYDPMGGGCRHMNVWQKSYQGWLSACNGVRVTNTGTFNLAPLELACNGPQFLQIKAPKARPFNRPAAGGGGATTENLDYYYLELRTPVDFDGALGGGSGLSPRVLVHMAANLRTRTDRGLHTFLLDMNPSTSSFDALPVGQTYNDPAGGLSFTVMSAGMTGATIQVTYTSGGSGDPTCMDGSAFTPPGPAGIESCSTTPTGAAGTTGGAAGTTGAGGRGGTTGAGGRGGTTGAAGRGGTTGAAGTTAAAGTNGAAGTFGIAGSNGSAGTSGGGAGTTGAGGSTPVTGTGGTTGSAGNSGQTPDDRTVQGGCACDTAGGSTSSALGIALMLASVAAVRRPRRRRA